MVEMRALIAACAVVLVSSCGSEPAPTAEELADQIPCHRWSAGSDELYVADGGTCRFRDADIAINGFEDNGDRDQWLEVADTFGGSTLVGDRWVIFTVSGPDYLDRIQKRVGGEVR